jgi:hypothetical protein
MVQVTDAQWDEMYVLADECQRVGLTNVSKNIERGIFDYEDVPKIKQMIADATK